MSKTIKLENRVYFQVNQLRGRKVRGGLETFSEVVAKLLTTKEGVDTMIQLWEREPREEGKGG